jgi:serine/threonine protein kinase
MIGQRYALEGVAGAGASGTVYKALDVQSSLHVAVKVLRDTSPLQTSRFLKEGEVLRSLAHPHVVRYIDHGQQGDVLYLVMEWVNGIQLRRSLRNGPLAESSALQFAQPLAGALNYLSQLGIVHRDIKPENILLVDGDVSKPMLVDLGIAKSASTLELTRTGVLLGTPRYMAPEQIRTPSKVDTRADIFSLGCILFECLAGTHLYEGDDPVAVLTNILLEPARRLSTVNPDVSPWVDALVAALTSRQPDARPLPEGLLRALDARRPAVSFGEGPTFERAPMHSFSALRDEAASIVSSKRTFVGRGRELAELERLLTTHYCAVVWGPPGVGKTALASEYARRSGRSTLWIEAPQSVESALNQLRTNAENIHAFLEAQGNTLFVFDAADACVDTLLTMIDIWQKYAPQVQFLVVSRVKPMTESALVLQLDARDKEDARHEHESIAAAWDNLDRCERALLLFGTLYRGAFSVASVSALLEPEQDSSIAVAIDSLVRKSLLTVSPLREWAAFKVPHAVRAHVYGACPLDVRMQRPRVRAHVLDDATALAEHFSNTGRHAWLAQLCVYTDDLEAMLEVSVSARQREEALRALLPLCTAWEVRGSLPHSIGCIDAVLGLPGPVSERSVRVQQLRGRFRSRLGMFELARIDLESAMTYALTKRDDAWQQTIAADLGVCHHEARNTETARAFYEQVVVASDGHGTRAEARAIANSAALYHDEGDLGAARFLYAKSVAMLEGLGDERQAGICLGNLAVLEGEVGRSVEAQRRFEQALAFLREVNDTRLLGITLGNFGMLALAQGDAARAVKLLDEAQSHNALAGDGRSEALSLARLGAAIALEGGSEAQSTMRRAKVLGRRFDPSVLYAIEAQEMLAMLARAEQNCEGDLLSQSRGDPALDAARETYRRLTTVTSELGVTPSAASDDVRAALRIAQRRFGFFG